MTTATTEELRGARVLLADDDPTFRLLAASSLGRAGFTVTQATTGSEALEAFSSTRHDIVLLDFEMPELDGFQVCEALRQRPETELTPVVVITGRDDSGALDRAYHAGATDFMTKPVNWELLPRRVSFVLRASRALADLKRSEALLARAQQAARLGSWEWNGEESEVTCSDELVRILGVDPRGDAETVLGRVHEEDRDRVRQHLVRIQAEGGSFDLDHRLVLPTGEERVVHDVATVVLGSGGTPTRAWGTVQDITDRKQAEREIWRLAHRDGLTGLANRRMLRERLEGALRWAGDRDKPIAVLYFDVDRFKRINDSFGHKCGDQVLREIAERVVSEIRIRDWIGRGSGCEAAEDVSRLGGDEFTVVLNDLDEGGQAMQVAQRLLKVLRRPFRVGDCQISASASIGIALFPGDGRDVDTLLRNADTAMYYAKRMGGDTFQFYSESMNEEVTERLVLESQIRMALNRNEFEIYYQPKVDAKSERLLGLEALIRWRHPERGLLAPGHFLPVAEESGLILRIGDWVVRTVCEQITTWAEADLRVVPVAVNVSGHQLRPSFVEFVAKTLQETRLEPRLLELEVTESALIRDEAMAREVLARFKEIGIGLAMDDFGTGYSSLSFLKRYAVDCLKIDREFISQVANSSENSAIVSAIIEMAHRLHLRVVAEGVETESDRDYLCRLHCDELQGYLVARPMPCDAATDLLEAAGPGGRTERPA